jgi:hypothetical protein
MVEVYKFGMTDLLMMGFGKIMKYLALGNIYGQTKECI